MACISSSVGGCHWPEGLEAEEEVLMRIAGAEKNQ
jgi:hypothetical protein